MAKQKDNFKAILERLVTDVLERSGETALNYKQVAAKLNLTDVESRNTVKSLLDEGVAAGNFGSPESGKYCLKEKRNIITGVVELTNDGSAFVIPEDEFERDVYIAPRKLRTALNGDKVKVYVYAARKGGSKRNEGEITEIITRAKVDFSGIVQANERYAFVQTDDRKMLHDIFLPYEEAQKVKNGQRVVVTLADWPEGAKNPIGRIKNVLGFIGENDTEMNAILAQFGFPLEFPKAVEAEADAIPAEISEEEIAKRRDYRNILTFTIDPEDAKDFDDAISIRTLPGGTTEVGVHIADVSHYVKPGTPLDVEGRERGTSVYLVDRVIPMLPERLSNDLCSLRPNEDKLCFAAIFELDDNANIVSEWFGRTVINSARRFTYEEAQAVIEGESTELAAEIHKLNSLAHILRDRKFKHGAINFETSEVRFKLDANGKPLGVYVKERKDAHKLIEDFMLLANKRVAEFVATRKRGKAKLNFVYRAHDAPDMANLTNFAQFAAKFGYKLQLSNEKEISKSINALMHEVAGKKEQDVLSGLAIRSMAKAIYTTKKHSHYGLAFDYYTHFTSPIRRYPDVMAHRLLEHYLEGGKNVGAEELEEDCIHASKMEKRAADAERASVKYKQAEFLKERLGETYKGIISGVTEWGMYVEIEENKCEGMVRLKEITDDFYILDEKNYCLIGQRKHKKYQIGDEVNIIVKRVDLMKRQIDFTLLP